MRGASHSPVQRFVREPLVHFLLLGAAIYGVYFASAPKWIRRQRTGSP